MQWSKLKKLTESRFASSVQGKVHLFTTHYGACRCGRAWITYNGEQIANFETLANLWKIHVDKAETNAHGHVCIDESLRAPGELLSPGEMNRWDLHEACWDLLNNISIAEALRSDNPVILGLAFMDSRSGKRRLSLVDSRNLHPLPRRLLEIRILEDRMERERLLASSK
jgi:hypothetical protein